MNHLKNKAILICNFRIGTEHCKKNYSTYGLSTLLKKHIKIQSNSLAHIKFIGKKKKENKCTIKDPELIQILDKISNNKFNKKDLLWSYTNGKKKQTITALDVNKYLK